MVTYSIGRLKRTRSPLILLGLAVVLMFGVLLPAVVGSGIAGFTGQRAIQFMILSLFAVIWLAVFSVKSDVALYFGLLVIPLLVSQTGMQVDLGRVRVSALELLILALAMCLSIVLAIRPQSRNRLPRVPSSAWLFLLVCLPLGLIFALARNIPAFSIITMVKGYYLYPLLLLTAFFVIRNRLQLSLYVLMGLFSAVYVSLTSGQYDAYDIALVGGSLLERLSGGFGIINQFGFYLASMALFSLAIVFYHPRIGFRLLAGGLAVICFVSMVHTLSRGAVLGFLAGLFMLSILAGRKGRIALLVSIALFLSLKGFLPEWFLLRFSFTSLNDHSTILRIYYLQTAWEAIQQYPFGAGWGAAFWLIDGGSLIPSNDLPWFHNDYLNLVAQIGFWGLAIFLWNWWRVYRYAWRGLRLTPKDGELLAYIVGGMAAVTGLLISAFTDHLLQRPDIAGQLWWMASVLLCAAHLARKEPVLGMMEGKIQ